MSVFGILPILEIHRGMWPGYIFSRFHEHLLVSNRFWHFAHFRNAQKHAIRLYVFLVLMSVFGILPILEMHRGMWSGYIFLVFMSICWFQIVFGILPILEIHRGMWSGYIFSRFDEHLLVSNRFWHFAHFRNAQKHAIRLYVFLVLMSVFGILPILEMHRGMWSGHIFSRFHARPQKSYQSKFQKRCPTKIKKQVKKKFSF